MLLYPRLPHVVAQKLAENLASMPLKELEAIGDIQHSDEFYAPTGGNRVSSQHLTTIREMIHNCSCKYGYPNSQNDSQRTGFDSESAETLHREMIITPHEASQDGVWEFMSCVMLPEIVRWRFPGPGRTNIERFMGGVRNVFQRSWWRAHLLQDESSENPYELVYMLREDEIVQLTERPRIAGSRYLSRHICRNFLETATRRNIGNRMFLMREAQKRIMRLSCFVSFDSMQEAHLSELIKGVFEQTADIIEH